MMRNRTDASISSGSMADIAFLLLIFFLVTTTIVEDKGLMIKLPPRQQDTPISEIHERNLFMIRINSQDKLLVEGEVINTVSGLRNRIKEFILNPNKMNTLADSPQKAVVSLKTNRGTSYNAFITVLDEVQAAYYEIYSDRAGISSEEFRRLDLSNPDHKKTYDKAREGIPMNISIAEPDLQ